MPGKHCCAVPKTFLEEFALAKPFLEQGLAKGQRCVFVADDNGAEVVRMALRSNGLDVAAHEASGRLLIVDSRETPLGAGSLDAQRLYEAWAAMADGAVAGGFSGLRVVVEMTWALHQDPDLLARYEKEAGPLFASKPLDALCVYNGNVFQESVVRKAAVGGHDSVVALPSR